MTNIEKRIEASQKLTMIFGRWPSFHDAEVIEFSLRRDEASAVILTTIVHLWDMTSEVDQKGFYVLRNHTLVTIRFHDVEDIKMEGFNHQNVIFGLEILEEEPSRGIPPSFTVSFDPSYGIDAAFKCTRIEVVETVACNEKGALAE